MGKCAITIKANGKDSELQVKLAKALNSETRAEDYMAIISGPGFKEKFGDWEAAGISGEITTDMQKRMQNLEPQLNRKKGTNQYYFELPGKVKFFINRKKIADIPSEYHSEITKSLSEQFLLSVKDQNKNTEAISPDAVLASIEGTIADYINSVDESPLADSVKEMLKGNAEKVLQYKDDFAREVIIFSEDLIGSYSAREYQGVIEEESDDTTDEDRSNNLGIGDSSEVNPLNRASANVKIMLSQIVDVNEDGDVNHGKYLQLPKLLELDVVYKTLLPALSDVVGYGNGELVVDVYDSMKERIKLIKGSAWTSSFIQQLQSRSDDFKTEFVQAFSMTKLNFYATEVDGNKYKVINATSTNSKESQIVAGWGNRFQNESIVDGKVSDDTIARMDSLLLKWKQDYSAYDKAYRAAKTQEEKDDANDDATLELLDILYSMGVSESLLGVEGNIALDTTDVYFEMNGGKENTRDTLRKLYDSTKRTITDIKNNKNKIVSDDGTFANPFANQKNLVNLAAAIATMDVDITDSNILANGGKSYYSYSNPTYLSNKLNEWKEDIRSKAEDFTVPTLLEELGQDSYTDNSTWRKHLAAVEITDPSKRRKESLKRIEQLEIGLASTFKSRGLNDGSDNKSIDYIDAVNDSINKMLGKSIGQKSYFPTIVPADKSRKMELTGLPMFESGIEQTKDGELYFKEKTLSLFAGYFVDEYNRMKKVAREIDSLPANKLVQHYHTGNVNGLQSQLFPEFSQNSTSEKFQALRESLYDVNGRPVTLQKGMSNSQNQLLKEAIKETLTERVNETKDALDLVTNQNQAMLDYYSSMFNNGATAMAGDYLVNGLISTIEYAKMFSGDPAYYKNPVDLIKRIPATYTDGQYLRITDSDSLIFNHAVIEGVEVESRYVQKIKDSLTDKSIGKAYNKVNTSDAQAWITPRRWRFIKQRLGQWGPIHRAAFKAMESGKKMSEAELKVAAQPLKGVYFEMNGGRPVYLKYSQAVLLPNLVKGTPMEALYNKMVGETSYDTRTKKTTYAREAKDEIHEVITTDGVKVGAVAPTRVNVDGSTELDPNFELNSVELSNRGWKLQQDLPVKKIHETNLGSQVQRTILSGMVMNGDYMLNGEAVKGKDLLEKFHNQIKTLSDIGKQNLTSRFSINKDGKIEDMDALYDALIKDLRSTGGNSNIISALEKETDFDSIPQIKNKVQSLFMSMMNKEVVKISTNGGSFIQVSPFLLETVSEDDASGIKIVSDNYDGKGLQPPRLSEDGKTVLPGQVMMPHTDAARLLKTMNLDITKMTGKEIMAVLDPSALEVIGYRIPNQGMSSNDYLEIVGILPEGMGDGMLVYDAIPGKTGSDFDIDKMFLMMNHVEVVDGKITKTQDESSVKYKQNEMIALYKSVLSSTLTYDAMMTSIDGKELRDDIVDLFPAPEMSNLELFSPIKQIKTKFEYASGAGGLGIVANQLIDHVAGQSLNLGLTSYLGQGTFVTSSKGKKMTSFDKVGDGSISNTLSAFLNAYVDIAKDAYITRGNHNALTSGVSLMLVRAGYDVKWINRFIGQPILKELIQITQDSQGKTAEPLMWKKKRVTPMEYLLLKNNITLPIDIEVQTEFSAEELGRNIVAAREDDYIGDRAFDAKVLAKFDFFQDNAKELTKSISASKPAVNGAGGSAMDRLIASNLIGIAEEGGIRNFDSKFKDTALGTYTDNSVNWIGEVLNASQLFLAGTKETDQTFNYVSFISGKGDFLTNKDFARALDKGFYAYAMSGTDAFSQDNTMDLIDTLPSTARALKDNNVRQNFLLSQLQFNKSKDGYEFITISSKNKPKHYQDKIYNDWLSLYEDASTKQFAINLTKYAFATSGFANNLGQFFTHIPHEILQDLNVPADVVEIKESIEKGDLGMDGNFVDQFLRNNAEDTSIVNRVSANQEDISIYGKYGIDQAFRKDVPPVGENSNYLTIKDKKGNINLYKLAGLTKEGTDLYVRISKLGYKSYKGSIVEYNYTNKIDSSMIPQNNIGENVEKTSKIITDENGSDLPSMLIENAVEQSMLEYNDLFSQKDVSLSDEDIIKKNLSEIIKLNNIKENKDC